jgi:hypothetical protein
MAQSDLSQVAESLQRGEWEAMLTPKESALDMLAGVTQSQA